MQRANPEDDDEALLRLHEQFVTSQQRPSVHGIVPSKRHQTTVDGNNEPPKRQSKFRASRNPDSLLPFNDSASEASNFVCAPAIIGDLVERNVAGVEIKLPSVATCSAFPEVRKRDTQLESSKLCKGKSIFATEMAEVIGGNDVNTAEQMEIDETLGKDSFYDEIHRENCSRLAAMTQQEILEAQRQLLERLDPSVVTFLRNNYGIVGRMRREQERKQEQEFSGSSVADAALRGLMEEQRRAESLETSEILMGDQIELKEDELPIKPVEASQKWLHMDKVERDKLKWMTLLSNESDKNDNDNNTSYVGRFDFEGNVLPPSLNVPTQFGLHHHGEQPEAPGYTLSELLRFLRSSVHSQRILALQVFSNVFKKHWVGAFDGCFDQPLLATLIDRGSFVILLRVAMDDNSSTNLAAAIKTLNTFLVSHPDEMCLDWLALWSNESPCLHPLKSVRESGDFEKSTKSDGSQEEQRYKTIKGSAVSEKEVGSGESFRQKDNYSTLKDDQLIAIDVVAGLVRMDVLQRIRYVLEVCKPDAAAVGCALQVLTRIARHSIDMAAKVYDCPRLMYLIVSEYIPSHFDNIAVSQGKIMDAKNAPLWLALKLVRILAQASREIARKLLIELPFAPSMVAYLTMDIRADSKTIEFRVTSESHLIDKGLYRSEISQFRDLREGKLPLGDALRLSLECVKTWRIFLSYGLLTDIFVDLIPTVIHRQMGYVGSLSVSPTAAGNMASHNFDCDYGACFLGCALQAIKAAALASSDAILRWELIPIEIINVVENAFFSWCHQFCCDGASSSARCMLSVCMDLLAEYYVQLWKMDETKTDFVIRQVDRICSQGILNVLISKPFVKLTDDMRQKSSLLLRLEERSEIRECRNLPSLHSIRWKSDAMPAIIEEHCPFVLLNSVSNLVWTSVTLNRTIREAPNSLLKHPNIVAYVREVLILSDLNSLDWFSRTETAFLYRLVNIAALEPLGDLGDLYHGLSFALLPALSVDRAAAIERLLKNVCFRRDFFREAQLVTIFVESMNLSPEDGGATLKAATGCIVRPTTSAQLQRAHSSLERMSDLYSNSIRILLKNITVVDDDEPSNSPTCFVTLFRETLFRSDWVYLALDLTLRKHNLGVSNLEVILLSLRTVLLLVVYHKAKDGDWWTVSGIGQSVHYCRLATLFLVDADSFLDTEVQELALVVFQMFLEFSRRSKWTMEKDWPYLAPFPDFYTQLLDQFEGVSYGDSLFAHFVLLPLMYSTDLRRLVCVERPDMLAMIRLKSDQCLLKLDDLSMDKEKDQNLTQAYSACLGNIDKSRNEFVYEMLQRLVQQ